MADSLYDDDVLLWSERQAEIIRALRDKRQDLPNDFDPENVAEEIESVGRSELASVERHLELVLRHVLKLYLDPGSPDEAHWRGEIFTFGFNASRRFAPSMAQRIILDELWSLSLERARLESSDPARLEALPPECPFQLGELMGRRVDGLALAKRLATLIGEARSG